MLIVNADDWGGWKSATDAALPCWEAGRVTSVSAMVFMEDSERAARLAGEADMEVGLHLNLNLPFTSSACPEDLKRYHRRTCCWLRLNKCSQLIYNPLLSRFIRRLYAAQVEEFERLYAQRPSHIDGHQHMHLCANILLGDVIPRGERVRRNFSFWPGEKGALNRAYRRNVDYWLARRYRLADYFFSLADCLQNHRLRRAFGLAKTANVELMAHPEKPAEYEWLMSSDFLFLTRGLEIRSYAGL